MIIGFTGTREGMSFAQSESLLRVLRELSPTEVHHGCCVGADAEVHLLAYLEWPTHGHPGPFGPLRMPLDETIAHGFHVLHAPKDYGARNQDIVDVCDVLVAAPMEMMEVQRGGTWQTVRRARKARKKVIIVWPDGRTS